jgi:hypothetical protein
MNDFQSEMNRTVQGFVAQISELARRAALDTLESAFGGHVARGGGSASAAVAGLANGARLDRVERVDRARGPRPRPGAKRSAADLDVLSERFASFVKANPGLRIEQINKELGTVTKELALPIRKLLADGTITSKGQKRSTTYFPGRKSAKN